MKSKYVWFLMLSLSPLVAIAGANFSLPIQTDADSPGYLFMLPEEVYEHAHYADLRDVRVLNALGDEVPMRLSKRVDQIKRTFSEVTLPVFSLNQSKSVPVNSKQVKTTWEGDVQSYTVTTSNTVQKYLLNQEAERLDTLLIDASSVQSEHAMALQLEWQFPTAGNRVFYVELSGSNDLSQWQSIWPKHKLIELNTGGRVVLENVISLKGYAYEFYQLKFLNQPIPEVLSVKASMQNHAINAELNWSDVDAIEVLDAAEHGHAIVWDLGGYFPVEAFKLMFDYKNLMADIQVYSRYSLTSSWRPVAQGSVYELGVGDMAMFNNQLRFVGNNHRYWKLESQSSISSQWLDGVSFAWRQHQIQFLAQGEGPYSLQFGNQQANQRPDVQWYNRLSQALKQSMFSTGVDLASMVHLKPKAIAVEANVEQPFNYSRWLFWGLLVVVLSLLLLMATKLLKEVADENKQ